MFLFFYVMTWLGSAIDKTFGEIGNGTVGNSTMDYDFGERINFARTGRFKNLHNQQLYSFYFNRE